MYDREQLKYDSKRLIREGRSKLLWKVAAYLLLVLTISLLVSYLNSNIYDNANKVSESVQYYIKTGDIEAFNAVLDAVSTWFKASGTSMLIAFVLTVIYSMLSAGFEWWCLLNTRHQPNDFRNFFDGFNFPFKLIGLIFLRSILITLGFILFIVPGIILSYGFAQSNYILFENPELGPMQCLRRSYELMRGHKWEYFVLSLSFIGWYLLSGLISGYIARLLSAFGLAAFAVYSVLFFSIWLVPYVGFTTAGYYNYLTGYVLPEELSQEGNA